MNGRIERWMCRAGILSGMERIYGILSGMERIYDILSGMERRTLIGNSTAKPMWAPYEPAGLEVAIFTLCQQMLGHCAAVHLLSCMPAMGSSYGSGLCSSLVF